MKVSIPKLFKHLRILYSIISRGMKTQKQLELFCKGKTLLEEDQLKDFLDVVYELRILNRQCKANTKSYFYGITITRNPNEQTLEEFLTYSERFKGLKAFVDSNSYSYGYECYDKQKNLINEHVHIFLDAGKYFSVKDFKKSFKYRIDVQRLTGEAIYKTANYIKKDNSCKCTEAYYSQYLNVHHGIKP